MNVEAHAVHHERATQDRELRGGAGGDQAEARVQHQPPRTHHQEKAQVPPAVAPGAQMRRTRASIRREHGRHFRDAPACQGGLHDHLARELHTRSAQTQIERCCTLEATQATVEVADLRGEEQSPRKAQQRVAEVTMQQGHGAPADAAAEAVADDQGIPRAQRCDESVELGEVVAAVGVRHDDEPAPGGFDATEQRTAIAAARDGYDARARLAGELGRAVRGAVVGNQHFTRDGGALEKAARFAHAGCNRFCLVETRHEDRQFQRGRLASSRVVAPPPHCL